MPRAPFRLAFRTEGNFINCYYVAEGEGMKDATLIGSFLSSILQEHPDIYEDWKLLMSNTFRAMIINVARHVGHKIDASDVEMVEQEPEKEGGTA